MREDKYSEQLKNLINQLRKTQHSFSALDNSLCKLLEQMQECVENMNASNEETKNLAANSKFLQEWDALIQSSLRPGVLLVAKVKDNGKLKRMDFELGRTVYTDPYTDDQDTWYNAYDRTWDVSISAHSMKELGRNLAKKYIVLDLCDTYVYTNIYDD